MNINKNNYEAFFLDYHEGNLTPQEVAELLLFVEQHPELKEEFESFENLTLDDLSSYTFENKEQLKKEVTVSNKDEYFIRLIEGTLSSGEEKLVNDFLKQHPQFLTELELYKKTRLIPEKHVFGNKNELKKIALEESGGKDELLISAVEGLLTKHENIMLEHLLRSDAALRDNFSLYQQTKLQADPDVIYADKESLKRKEQRVIPLFYYVSSIAAAVLLLMGLFFIFNNNGNSENKLALGISASVKNRANIGVVIHSINSETTTNSSPLATTVKASIKKIVKDKKIEKIQAHEEHPLENIALADQANDKPNEVPVPEKNELKIQDNNNTFAKTEELKKAEEKEFMSLAQIAAARIKEKTLDPEVLAMQKKSGRLKKFSGWDALQLLAKGVSKVTGRNVEAKPTYNEEGEVTAYALGAGGFQISRGK
jgi:hypothetical protein